MDEAEERRQFFRIIYPSGNAAKARMGGAQVDVLAIAEGSIRIVWPSDPPPEIGSRERLVIHAHCDLYANVSGKVHRLDGNQVIIKLVKKIPLRVIMKEQQFLISKFGALRDTIVESEDDV